MQRKKIIFNPKKISRFDLELILRSHSIPFKEDELVMTEYKGNGTGLTIYSVNKEGIDLIVGVGGDGIVNEILNGIMQTGKQEHVLTSIIPKGSGVDICDGFLGTKDINIALQILSDYIKSPQESMVRVADIGLYKSDLMKKYFANTFSFGGISVKTVVDRESFKNFFHVQNLKRYDFIVPVSALSYKPIHAKVKVYSDKTAYEFEKDISEFQVLNSRNSGGGLPFAPNAKINDGFLDLLYLDKLEYIDILKLLDKLKKGKHIGEKGVNYVEKIVKIDFIAEPQHFQTDGEIAPPSDSKEHSIEVIPHSFRYVGSG